MFLETILEACLTRVLLLTNLIWLGHYFEKLILQMGNQFTSQVVQVVCHEFSKWAMNLQIVTQFDNYSKIRKLCSTI